MIVSPSEFGRCYEYEYDTGAWYRVVMAPVADGDTEIQLFYVNEKSRTECEVDDELRTRLREAGGLQWSELDKKKAEKIAENEAQGWQLLKAGVHGYRLSGHAWLGQRVRRNGAVGTVISWAPADSDGPALWWAVHDDGDAEDLDEEEVQAALAAFKSGGDGAANGEAHAATNGASAGGAAEFAFAAAQDGYYDPNRLFCGAPLSLTVVAQWCFTRTNP